jgi:hypothetical protein
MTNPALTFTQTIVPWLALGLSMIAGIIGTLSYRLAIQNHRELKGDEVLVAGILHNPTLSHPDHENCVLQTTIINKSKRKAYINGVQVFGKDNAAIDINWSDRIDPYGNPEGGGAQIIAVVDATSLCIRRCDGKAFSDVRVEVRHSFATEPMVLIFDPLVGWQGYFAQ